MEGRKEREQVREFGRGQTYIFSRNIYSGAISITPLAAWQYVTRRLCIKKMPGRAPHESNPILGFLRLLSSSERAHRIEDLPRMWRERERERTEFSFRDTEFIFPEEIRKAILRGAFRELPPTLPSSSLPSILLELYPDTIYHGNVGKKTEWKSIEGKGLL